LTAALRDREHPRRPRASSQAARFLLLDTDSMTAVWRRLWMSLFRIRREYPILAALHSESPPIFTPFHHI